jgi:hypothetical protein
MWQNIADFDLDKRSSSKNQETTQTSVKWIRMKCSWPNYGRIRYSGYTTLFYEPLNIQTQLLKTNRLQNVIFVPISKVNDIK